MLAEVTSWFGWYEQVFFSYILLGELSSYIQVVHTNTACTACQGMHHYNLIVATTFRHSPVLNQCFTVDSGVPFMVTAYMEAAELHCESSCDSMQTQCLVK